ncbi:pleckstrin homology domain-containing family B member 1 isoform X1 [Sinocyclocheilus rhinocerous]|uniref:pleckstrin homology domain-containing family B member 1 isoform X1 n=1 Tax=Sinocyclocheilus rhinocerous TaxID=307959 RepID=UPI0007B908F1|nr:PREDICTED: pleckstrin homology domain-containing family B member 1-like isoform X1 [Sinocyclocheilus rhinocerous]
MALLKSGWLWRQTSVLKRWKLNWCDLWIDGSFVFYKTESRRDYEAKVNLKATCVNVKSGLECPNVCPPESHPRENLLVVFLRDGNMLILCANSEDEALAWKLTLMEAKINPVLTYNPYDDTYQTIPINSHNAVYIMPSTGSGGTQHVWVHRDSYDGSFREQIALGLLAGMAAGAAMCSLLWMPFWFC